MNISDLLTSCKINSSDMEEFLHIHPKQLVGGFIPIPVWKIHYSYYTARGNPKDAYKYMIRNENDWDRIEDEFKHCIEEANGKHPERKLSNVKILDVSFMGEAVLEIE